MSDKREIRRALISVYDKTGLAELAQGLNKAGIEIVSTGSTAKLITKLGISVVEVKDVTGFAEFLDGRVKTLHPNIHAGLLGDLTKPEHVKQLDDLGIKPFELVIVNLYPFAETVLSGASVEECIEQIDIGGPAMVRGSAKNYTNVAIVVNPKSYDDVLEAVAQGGFTKNQRIELAIKAFRHVAQYDVSVASWLDRTLSDETEFAPSWLGAIWERTEHLRYGENPHQTAALYLTQGGQPGIAQAQQLHGKSMSYNNYVDADAARRAAYDHLEPSVVIIKHANPCGVAIGESIEIAYDLAHATDSVSAFGGVIATNRIVTQAMARKVAEVFTEVIVAPGFEPEALAILSMKENIRILIASEISNKPELEMRPISGGMLLQTADRLQADGDDPNSWQLVSGNKADAETMRDLIFAWQASRCVKSNGILLAKNGGAVGIGMGQVNRVDSAKLAVSRAGTQRAHGSVAASDAFFPFADGLQVLIDAGVKAIVQPGGSVRDSEVIDLAKTSGVTMYFTGTRHFSH